MTGAPDALPLIAASRLADRLDDNISNSPLVRYVVLDEVAQALVFGVLEHCRQVFDLTVAFFDPGAEPVPRDLFLLCGRASDDDLASLPVDDDVVRVGKGLGASQAEPFATLEFLLPLMLILYRRRQVFVPQCEVGALYLRYEFRE